MPKIETENVVLKIDESVFEALKKEVIHKHNLVYTPKNENGVLILDCYCRAIIESKKFDFPIDIKIFAYFELMLTKMEKSLVPETKSTHEVQKSLEDLNTEFIDEEATEEIQNAVNEFLPAYYEVLHIQNPASFKIKALSVNAHTKNTDDDIRYRSLSGLLRGVRGSINNKTFNPYSREIAEGDTSEIVLFREDSIDLLDEIESGHPGEEYKTLKHEIFHTQKHMSWGRIGSLFSELCTEEASNGEGSYTELERIWYSVYSIFDFNPTATMKSITQSAHPLKSIFEELENKTGSFALFALLTYVPDNYEPQTKIIYDISKLAFDIAIYQKKFSKIEETITSQAEKVLEVVNKRNGLASIDDVIRVSYLQHNLFYMANRVKLKANHIKFKNK